MASDAQMRQRHIVRNTAMVMVLFAMAAASGLLRNIVIARQFGIGADLDSYYAAFKLPDLLFTIVAGGALATAFIPVFARFLARDDRAGAWRLAAALTNLVVLVTSALAIIAAVFAPALVRYVLAPGFNNAQQAETVELMRLVLISIPVFGISAVQSSVLHGFKHFLLPALAPVVYPLGITCGALWLAPHWGVRGLAVGAVAGSILHLAVKLPALLHYGFRWWPVLDLRTEAVRRVLYLMGPRILDLGVFHLTLIATTNLASRLGPGSISALEWGWDAMQLPETIIGTAFGLVAFPTLSDLAARGDRSGLRRTLGETLRTVIALALPAAAGLLLLGRPVLQLLYQRGAFDAEATAAVYEALAFFSLGLVGHVCLELAARTFFAMEDTVTPLLIAAGSAVTNILLGIALMGPLAYGGLALANSVAVSLEVVALLLILSRRLGGVEGRETLRTLGLVIVASALMGVVVALALRVAQAAQMGTLATVAMTGACGASSYVVLGWLLHIEALTGLPRLLLAKR